MWGWVHSNKYFGTWKIKNQVRLKLSPVTLLESYQSLYIIWAVSKNARWKMLGRKWH